MIKTLLAFTIFVCLFACSDEPYRVVQMESGNYVVQIHFGGMAGGWYTMYDVYIPNNNKEQACKVRNRLIAQAIENKKSITVRKVIKCQ